MSEKQNIRIDHEVELNIRDHKRRYDGWWLYMKGGFNL